MPLIMYKWGDWVELFFMMSGFLIEKSYKEKITSYSFFHSFGEE